LAVIPLKRNDENIVKASQELKNKLQQAITGRVLLENTGNIGKSYRKHDEIGTPACITVDFQSLEDNTFTVRDRDSMTQERVHLDEVRDFLLQKYNI
jgi:glycyl-tRNA synthetase